MNGERTSASVGARGADVGKYCLWAMNRKGGEPPIALTAEEEPRVQKWIERADALVDEAQRLAVAGETRGGVAFDSLKQRSLTLADEFFSGPQRGCVFIRVAQAFDRALAGGGAPAHPKRRNGEIWQDYGGVEDRAFALLKAIQKFSGWGEQGANDFEQAQRAFLTNYPGRAELVERALSNGRLFNKVQRRAYKLGTSGAKKKKLFQLLAEAGIPRSLESSFVSSFEKGRIAAQKALEAELLCGGRPVTNANVATEVQQPEPAQQCSVDDSQTSPTDDDGISTHPNSILKLKPSKQWTIVTDETGTVFDNRAFDDGTPHVGRYAFVLVPDYARIPDLTSGWHAVERSLGECLKVAENLVASGAGIIGLPVEDLYRTNRRLWFACIESLLDVVLRLLPLDGETKVTLNVEQCGDKNRENDELLSKTLDDAMYRLSLTNPDRARKIRLDGHFVAKQDCRLNGYADLVAYSWGCNPVVQKAFARFGWVGPCLISEKPEVAAAFRRCLQLVHQAGTLDAADWNTLVTSREATSVGSLIGALLRGYGDEARVDAGKWRIYLNYVLAHLDSKAIRMSLLAPQIAWLKEYEPDGEQLPPRLRLLWLTAQLAASNHRGGTQFGLREHAQEFEELMRSLKDEDAPLTCFAALHLAVEKTDCFQFEEARAMLLPWLDEPIAVPGLRYHAQVLSSLGQHEAFLGNNEKALEYFDKAFMEFTRLSEGQQREIDHTLAYAVIAAMDANSPRLPLLMAAYLYGGAYTVEGMVDMANQFATVGEDEPDSKYAHTIFLRYLMTLPEDDPVRTAYVASLPDWKDGTDGHPWEMIAFYRAFLCSDKELRVRYLKQAFALAEQGGPTLQIIATVILGSLLEEGEVEASTYAAKVESVIAQLPALGSDRIAALREQTTGPQPGILLAEKVLPFNFR